MIRLFLGGLGSGKTVCAVKEALDNPAQMVTYSNIETKNIPLFVKITQNMLVKKTVIGETTTRGGIVKEKKKLEFNQAYWQNIMDKKVNVMLDEAHTLLNPRRSMSTVNIIMNDFMSMLRRILGSSDDYGELTLITQLPNRLDVNARDLATEIRHHRCWYKKTCSNCGCFWTEFNDMPEKWKTCPKCKHYKLIRSNFQVEVWHFSDIETYTDWRVMADDKMSSKHYLIKDIDKYFGYYNTHSWEDMMSGLYN